MIAAVAVALRAVAYFRYRFDSDEPQHLHVAWGWTAGLVQYRDYFDNHAPLFHMLSAPLLKALGERPDILLYMRAPMLPLYAIVLACTYGIARRVGSERSAIWAAAMLSIGPSFFLRSIEYRTDNLWNTVWMVALLVLTGGPPTASRMFSVGLILGIAACVSLKTSLLVLSLALAALATWYSFRERPKVAELIAKAASFLAGLVIAPAAVLLYFAHLRALPNLAYCVYEFNKLIAHTHGHVLVLRMVYPFALWLILSTGRRVASRSANQPADRTRFFLGMFLAMFVATLCCFWVLIGPRDLLPIEPLIAIFACVWIVRTMSRRRALPVFAAASVLFVVAVAHDTDWFADRTTEYNTMMKQVLRLTRPGELLMDLKGETVYRQRPYYFIFEKITRDAMQAGLLRDGVADAVVKRRCYVAQADGTSFPPRSRMFLSANFMDLGRLRAAGQWVRHDGTFSVAIPGEYVLLDVSGEAAGVLDGRPYTGHRLLAAGDHRFVASRNERIALLWAPAFERGFSPFHLQDRDF